MKKYLLLLSILVISITSVSAQQVPEQRVNDASISGIEIQQSDIYQKNIFDRFSDTLFAFTGVQDTYSPGETIDVTLETETSQTFNTGDATKVVTVYKCADSQCDDPAPVADPTDDSCSQEEFYPTYDDCIARNTDDFSSEYEARAGARYWFDTSFSGFDDDATYILQGYLYTWTSSEGWQQVSSTSEERFTVEAEETEPELEPEPEPEPEGPSIEAVGTPEINVDDDTGQVQGTVTLKNTGGKMQENYIVEMQVRDETGGLLSFVSNQGTCDSDQPANVHKEFRLDSGEEATINLDTKVEPTGEDFQIRFVTATDCIADGGSGELVPPYEGGSYYTENVQIGYDEPDVVSYREPEITTNGLSVDAKVFLENNGGPMTQRDIVEMQIKTPSDNFLSFIEPQTDICDPDHPENVHKEYRLDSGDKASIQLTSRVPESGTYDIVILTVDQCGLGSEGNRGFVEPFNGWQDEYRVSSVEVRTSDNGGGNGETGNGLPVNPLILVVGALFIVVAGVVAFRG